MKSRSLLRRRTPAGFTLVEILVTVSLIALLAALSVVAMGHATRTANIQKTKSYLQAIELFLDNYQQDYGTYPRPKEGGESATTLVGGNNYPVGGAITLYQALTADGDDSLENGETGSMGKAGSLGPEAKVYWAAADPSGSQRISRQADGKWYIGDGFGIPFQYVVPPPVDPRNADNFEALKQKYRNPRKYDLWSYGGTKQANFTDQNTWIKNWE